MEIDATPQPLPAPSASSPARPGSHLQLVADRPVAPAPAPEPPAAAGLDVEPDPSAPWSQERILGLLEAFHSSEWGACLTPDGAGAVTAVLMTTERHSFRGVAGLPFLADCLRTDGLDGPLGEQTLEVLRQVPNGLRQFVRFVDRLGAGTLSEITLAKLEYLDRSEPAWQAAVTRRALQARIDELGLVDELQELAADLGTTLLRDPLLVTGDAEVLLESIWTERLREEPVQLQDLDPDTALRVLEISGWCDRVLRFELDDELRNAARRLLERIAHADPAALRRPTAQAIAAGICHAVVHGNVERVHPRSRLTDASIARQLGISPSGIADRARRLLGVTGVVQPPARPKGSPPFRPPLRLGDPALLTASRRQYMAFRARTIVHHLATADALAGAPGPT